MSNWKILTVLIWLCLALFTLQRISVPPAPDTLDLDPDTQQAVLDHLRVVAAEPHPIGSAAHAAVRQYLIDEIASVGLRAEVQQATLGSIDDAVLRWAEPDVVLNNVLTRIEGSGEGKAVLLVSHYDSAPESFGAGDDGAAVASMLDLLARVPQRSFTNDVIFLFTDAEENCLCGARAFARTHPWASDVGVVLNFEARGSAGKSVMFEATPGYGTLVRTYAANAVHPATSSIYQTVYELLPNDTDLTAFREQGMHGINMAFIDAQQNYHTAADRVDNLDPASLMHQYANMRAMLLALANADLERIREGDPVFFDVLGLFVVIYSPLLAYAAAAATLALVAYLMYENVRQRSVRVKSVAAAAVVLLLTGAAVVWSIATVSGFVADTAVASVVNKKSYLGVCIVAGMLLFGVAIHLAAKGLGRRAVDLATFLLWLILLLGSSVLMPKVSYIFLWPLLCILVTRCLRYRSANAERIGECLAYVPLIILWTQLAYALLLAMSVAAVAIVVGPMLLASALMQTHRLASI